MPPAPPPLTATTAQPFRLRLPGEGGEATAVLAYSWGSIAAPPGLLTADERAILAGLPSEPRRESWLLGRRAVKAALCRLTPGATPDAFTVINAASGAPLVAERGAGLALSLSHCRQYGAALAMAGDHALGVDVEEIRPGAADAVAAIATPAEHHLIRALPMAAAEAWIAAWALKESLGKALRTGLRAPLARYELADLTPGDDGCHASFRNFPAHQGITIHFSGHVCAMVLPGEVDRRNGLRRLVPPGGDTTLR